MAAAFDMHVASYLAKLSRTVEDFVIDGFDTGSTAFDCERRYWERWIEGKLSRYHDCKPILAVRLAGIPERSELNVRLGRPSMNYSYLWHRKDKGLMPFAQETSPPIFKRNHKIIKIDWNSPLPYMKAREPSLVERLKNF